MSKKPSDPKKWHPATLAIHGLGRVPHAHYAVSTHANPNVNAVPESTIEHENAIISPALPASETKTQSAQVANLPKPAAAPANSSPNKRNNANFRRNNAGNGNNAQRNASQMPIHASEQIVYPQVSYAAAVTQAMPESQSNQIRRDTNFQQVPVSANDAVVPHNVNAPSGNVTRQGMNLCENHRQYGTRTRLLPANWM